MPSALITGITGQDGSYLAELLLSKGYQVTGLVRRSSVPNTRRIDHILNQVTLVEGDLIDPASLRRAVEVAQPDEVYNLAAQSHVGTSFAEPAATMQYNGLAVIHLLEAIRQVAPLARFYQASTSELFGNAVAPQNENTPFSPRSPYGVSKATAHYAVVNAREAWGLYTCCGILFNHESPRRSEQFVTRKVTKAVARIAAGQQEQLSLGNPFPRRDWGFAGDYVAAMWRMMQCSYPLDFVIATGIQHSVQDLVATAFQAVGIEDWKRYVRFNAEEYRPADVYDLCGDITRARRMLGWEPATSFEQLIGMMVAADQAALVTPPAPSVVS